MKTHPWPAGIIVFFIFIAAVNGVLIHLAVNGYGGMLDQHPYEKGLQYDQEFSEKNAFLDSQWTATLGTSPLTLNLHEASGAPIDDAKVVLRALRPDDANEDQQVNLKAAGGGTYTANLSLRDGRWLMTLTIERKAQRYRINRSVFAQGDSVVTLQGENK